MERVGASAASALCGRSVGWQPVGEVCFWLVIGSEVQIMSQIVMVRLQTNEDGFGDFVSAFDIAAYFVHETATDTRC